MKIIILLVTLVLASSVTYAEIIGSGIDTQSGQQCTLIKSESDGTGNKANSDGTGKTIEGDGSNNKTGNDGTDNDYDLILVCK